MLELGQGRSSLSWSWIKQSGLAELQESLRGNQELIDRSKRLALKALKETHSLSKTAQNEAKLLQALYHVDQLASFKEFSKKIYHTLSKEHLSDSSLSLDLRYASKEIAKSNLRLDPLEVAIKRGLDELALYLIDLLPIEQQSLNNWWLAVRFGRIHVLELLLQKGFNIQACDVNGRTALHFAILRQDRLTAHFLLDHGANPWQKDRSGHSCLDLMLQDPLSSAASSLLIYAVCKGRLDLLIEALERGVPVDSLSSKGLTALQMAASSGQVFAMHILLAAGANVDALSSKKWKSIHFAVKNGHANVVELLLQANPDDLEAQIGNQATPLHLAALYGSYNVAKVLLQRGANLQAVSADGLTPLEVAEKTGNEQLIHLLAEAACMDA